MARYRCRHEIVADMLRRVTQGPSKASHIAMAANLPLDRAKKLIMDMVSHGLLIYNPHTREYEATDLAYEWLALYDKLRSIYNPG